MNDDQLAPAVKRLAPNVSIILVIGFCGMMKASDERPLDVDLALGKQFSIVSGGQAIAPFAGVR